MLATDSRKLRATWTRHEIGIAAPLALMQKRGVLPSDIRSYADLLAAFRARRDDLRVTNETIDEIAGVAQRYTQKLLATPPVRRFAGLSLGVVLGALGLKMTIAEDPEQTARIRRRLEPRKRRLPAPLAVDDDGDLPWIAVDFPSRALLKECSRLRSENKRLQQELEKSSMRDFSIPPLPAQAPRRKRVSPKARHKLRRRASNLMQIEIQTCAKPRL
jgi:hypothetical protein